MTDSPWGHQDNDFFSQSSYNTYMQKILTGVGVVLVLLAIAIGISCAYPHAVEAPTVSGEYTWSFEEMSEQDGIPQTQVSIVTENSTRVVGTYPGSCFEQADDLLPNQKSKVVCWYAGGGYEIGVFSENGVDVVKVGEVDEGSAETPGFRGNFQTIIDLSVVAPQEIEVIGYWECLPHKPGYPQTEECLTGLAIDQSDGHYALDLSAATFPAGEFSAGDKVRVRGRVTPAMALSSDHWMRYDMDGVLSVTTIEKL